MASDHSKGICNEEVLLTEGDPKRGTTSLKITAVVLQANMFFSFYSCFF